MAPAGTPAGLASISTSGAFVSSSASCGHNTGADFVDDLNGIFAFAIYDSINDEFFIARDHMGIIPLYMGWDAHGTFYVASELKALEGVCTKIELFPPPGEIPARKWSDFDQIWPRVWSRFWSSVWLRFGSNFWSRFW